MTSSDGDERIARLEEHIAHQTRTIEELSAEMEKQWSVVDRLERKQEKLIERLLALEESTAEETPVARPPHY